MNREYVSLGVFICAYLLFILLPTRRSLVAVGGVLALGLTGTLAPLEIIHAINWNVMGIFVGTLIAADVFIESRFPAWFAEVIVKRAPNTTWAILFICMLTSFISAFVENVATVLIVAPIALSLARRININPVNMMIGIAIASNLQGTATLIGDPPSMLLGGYAKMTFMDFFFYQGKPSIFFAVEFGAFFSFLVLYWVFSKHRERAEITVDESVKSWIPTIMLVLLVATLAASSFFDKGFSYLAGIICMVFGVAMLLFDVGTDKGRAVKSLWKLDWDTTFFLMGVFVIVESLVVTGWIESLSVFMSGVVGGNPLWAYIILIACSIIISGFVDNVPYLAAMLPVAGSMAAHMGIPPQVLLFGLLIGASLGGNITPIGASANVVACGLLRKEGHVVTFRQFGVISIPFTLAAVIPSAILIWFIWGP